MEHCGQAELRTEALRVFAEREQRLAAGRKERVEEERAVAQRDAAKQVVGHREDDVEVGGRQEPQEPPLHPARLRERLAGRAVAVPAGVEHRALEAAVGADLQPTAKDRSPAVRDRAQHLALVLAQRVLALQRRAVGSREQRLRGPSLGALRNLFDSP